MKRVNYIGGNTGMRELKNCQKGRFYYARIMHPIHDTGFLKRLLSMDYIGISEHDMFNGSGYFTIVSISGPDSNWLFS